LRVNVYLPDDLAAAVKQQLPDLNVSQALQGRLRDLLGCPHGRAVCSDCAAPVDVETLASARLERFYADVMDDLLALVIRGGTAEGAARAIKAIGERYRLVTARNRPLPRPTRAERIAAKVRPLPGTEEIA
jgi:hypothetical protein